MQHTMMNGYDKQEALAFILERIHAKDHPELADEAVRRLQGEGMKDLFTFAMPDYEEKDFGARAHPNAEWNRMAGNLLADFLKKI